MHKSNLPSIISSANNETIQSCLVNNDIIFLGLRNGIVEIFEWKTNLKITEITTLFDFQPKKTEKELKFNPHSNQIVSIQLLKEIPNKFLLVYIQSRGGIIFIIQYDTNKKNTELLNKYESKTESFTEFYISNKIFKKEWLNSDSEEKNNHICNLDSDNIYKIIYSLEKDNEIDVLFYEIINENNKLQINYIQKINQNFDYIIDEESDKIVDVYKDMESKITHIINLSNENNDNNYIILAYEKTLIYILDEKLNYKTHYSISFSLKIYESIINIYSFKYKENYYICVGLFSQNLLILKYDNNILNLFLKINEICPEVKYGVSCFTSGTVIGEDLFMDEDLVKNKFLLFVGSYAKRVKVFEINENEDGKGVKFNDLGNLIVDNSGSLNQIHFFDGHLFVLCDRKLMYIYAV